MSGHLDGPPPGPPDPPYIPGDLGAPSAKEFARRRAGDRHMSDDNYTLAHPVAAEGSRIGLITCRKCGVTLTLDMELDVMQIHDEWHRRLDALENPADLAAAILVDPAEVLSPEELAEYERCQQSVMDARRRAPMVEGQMIVGVAASPDERLRERLLSDEAVEAAAMTYEPDTFIGDAPNADDALRDARAVLVAALAAADRDKEEDER